MNKIKKETDMFLPIKALFTAQGYKVNAEVKGFDIVLSKDKLVIVETKLNFNITLLYQGINAQKVADIAYIAIPTPAHKKSRDIAHIANSLNLGLIFVGRDVATVMVEPGENTLYTNYKKRKRVKEEVAQRKFDTNKSGSTKVALITAYKEKSLQIACALMNAECASPKALVKLGCPQETQKILYTNSNRWFTRPARGKYALSSKGRAALEQEQYGHVVSYYFNNFLDKDLGDKKDIEE
ncbi:MAG: DUF2161 family putative PD-(D/E)XK-type phosphodiesterase [Defluviitaleaceae bacterium]|nr:DUF2161 family putative PD-(D/E)XK-type phosphodiesterase [Defluviitaleaceae bacterium]